MGTVTVNGRPPEPPEQLDTRDKILRAAAKAFADRGFEGATFRGIGEAAGINFQSIRYHFGSKEKLWEAVVDYLHQQAGHEIARNERVVAALEPREQLRAQIEAFVTYQSGHPELQRILLREAMKDSERYRKAFAKHVKRAEKELGRFLGRLQEQGVVKTGIPLEDLYLVFRGALNYRIVAPSGNEYNAGTRQWSSEAIRRHADAISRLLLVG